MKKIQLSEKAQGRLWAIIAFIAMLMMLVFYTPTTHAQQVVRKGNQFELVKKDKQADIKTEYTIKIGDRIYPVYKSARGKYYIIRTSKSGKQYRQYVTKIIEGE